MIHNVVLLNKRKKEKVSVVFACLDTVYFCIGGCWPDLLKVFSDR